MNLRPAGAADRQAIASIHAASWRDSYRAYVSDAYYADLDARLGAHWAQLVISDRDILLLAEDGKDPVGFILAWDGEPCWVNTLHTMPAHRSSGVGSALMAEAARRLQAQGRNSLYLDVITTNTRAIAFYERLGGIPGAVKEKLVGDRMIPNLRIDFPDLNTIIASA